MTTSPPHGLPRELSISGSGEHGFIFLNDFVVPITIAWADDGSPRFTVGKCEPEAKRQLDDWMASQLSERGV